MRFRSNPSRAVPAATAAAALVALALTGCAGGGEPAPVEGCTPSGSASQSIQAEGDFGSKPDVSFESPLEVNVTQRSVVIEGEGDPAESGDTVDAEFTIFDATTGEELLSTGHDGTQTQAITLDESFIPGIVKAFECATPGTRVAVVVPSDDLGETQFTESGGPIVIVGDLVGVREPAETSEWTENVPDVTFNGDEPPTLELPDTDPPGELLLHVIELGDGDIVEQGASVTLNYQGTSWDTDEIFDQSYGAEPATFSTSQVIEGFSAALVGQPVGTQLVVAIPPEFAYGPEGGQHPLSGQTLVFVIEILETA